MTDLTAPPDDLAADSAAQIATVRHNYRNARALLGLDRPADYTLPTEEPRP
jgi:hypothetical protein